jgi:hypothetical protein
LVWFGLVWFGLVALKQELVHTCNWLESAGNRNSKGISIFVVRREKTHIKNKKMYAFYFYFGFFGFFCCFSLWFYFYFEFFWVFWVFIWLCLVWGGGLYKTLDILVADPVEHRSFSHRDESLPGAESCVLAVDVLEILWGVELHLKLVRFV